MDEKNDDNKKGFIVALISIATVCTIIFIGIILFFPNKNLASDIAEQNIVLEEEKESLPSLKQNEEKSEETLEISEGNNEIVIDLTKDLKKNRNISENKEIVRKEDILPLDTKPEVTNSEKKDESSSSKTKETTKSEENKPTTNKPVDSKKEDKINEKVQNDETKEKPKTVEKETKVKKEINSDDKYDPDKEYYIQFVSLSDPIIADNNIKNLSKYKLNTRIYSATVNGKEIYRVRSGPYKTVSEAKADLAKIAGINEFKDAYFLTISK